MPKEVGHHGYAVKLGKLRACRVLLTARSVQCRQAARQTLRAGKCTQTVDSVRPCSQQDTKHSTYGSAGISERAGVLLKPQGKRESHAEGSIDSAAARHASQGAPVPRLHRPLRLHWQRYSGLVIQSSAIGTTCGLLCGRTRALRGRKARRKGKHYVTDNNGQRDTGAASLLYCVLTMFSECERLFGARVVPLPCIAARGHVPPNGASYATQPRALRDPSPASVSACRALPAQLELNPS